MDLIREMLDELASIRAKIAEVERAEHPPIRDAFGRTWTWISGDLYGHDGMAWPVAHIQSARQLPSDELMSNPNYNFCHICRGGR